MEKTKLCPSSHINLPNKDTYRIHTQGNLTTQYGKTRHYNTPLCAPFQNKVFMRDEEPNLPLEQDMCRVNNGCKDDSSAVYLNQRGVKPSPYFMKNKGEFYPKAYTTVKHDGRMVDSARNYIQKLDSKPIQVVYDLINDNISGNPELKNYGQNYTDYSNVSGGQIQYYIDKEIAEPFHKPIYAEKTPSIGYTYKDPMDSVKPQFEKQYAFGDGGVSADGNTQWASLGKGYPSKSFTGLSWLDDSCSFRDDITSKQQRTHNEQRYDLVYNKNL